ncbi:hypothetical protein [Alcanivorax sp. 1008]|uniref:hypothetical protein n=1 Tax=Alcanivorax sp. 1008 TaxID=2816853 RepID=UPI001D9A6886|nr:hypothetical protein [Alcanivorax sp. 1008]MCC1495949.1 hypothetical protein [Alcanivorax sp. 1008]
MKLYCVFSILFSFLLSAQAVADDTENLEVRELIDHVLASLERGEYAELADLYHYPKEWSADQLKEDKCNMEKNLAYMGERFGKPLSARTFKEAKNYLHLGIMSASNDFWSNYTQTMTVELDIEYQKEGSDVLVLELVKIGSEIKLKAIVYGLKLDSPMAVMRFKEFGQEFTLDRKKRAESGVCTFGI